MTLKELKDYKQFLGYSNEMLAEKSGVPVGTLQKILSGETKAPRYRTIRALEKAIEEGLKERSGSSREYVLDGNFGISSVRESSLPDGYGYGAEKVRADVVPDVIEDAWTGRWRRQGTYTVDDYDAIPDEVRVELIDGVIYDMSAPTFDHQEISGEIYMLLKEFRKSDDRWKDCRVVIAPYDVELCDDRRTVVQPDVLVFCGKDKKDYKKRLKGAPDFAVEVLSPSTRRKDFIIKAKKYMDAGVKEYWIVDPEKEEVWVYDFGGNDFPVKYTFDDSVPVMMTGGKLRIDFRSVRESLS